METSPSGIIIATDERDIVLAALEQEREVWLPLKAKVDRNNGNAIEAVAAEAASMARINALLEDLSALAINGTQAE